jgi:hypothetical protein
MTSLAAKVVATPTVYSKVEMILVLFEVLPTAIKKYQELSYRVEIA